MAALWRFLAVASSVFGVGLAWDCGVNATAGATFGVGGPESFYTDGEDACWVLRGEAQVTLVFSFFHTEHNHDVVTVYDGVDDSRGVKLSGELPSPYIFRSEHGVVMVHFKADASYHTSAATKQKGFRASYFDSSDGACYDDCGGHGACVEGLCVCEGEYGADYYTDCSTSVRTLEDGAPLVIDGLAVGEWAYFRVVLPEKSHVLVELVDWGAASADPRLVLSVDTLPTLSHYRMSDWFNWFYDCSDIHYIHGDTTKGGVNYVGVTNDQMRGDATGLLHANVTVRISEMGTMRCLLDCNGHGTCDEATGDCACDEGWLGSVANAPDTCQFEVQNLELDTVYESEVRIGNWDYYAFDVSEAQAARDGAGKGCEGGQLQKLLFRSFPTRFG